MIQDIEPKVFDNDYHPTTPAAEDPVVCFYGSHKREDQILLQEEEVRLPKVKELREAGMLPDDKELIYLFSVDERHYYLFPDCDRTKIEMDGFTYSILRTLRLLEDEELSFAGVTAYHLFTWYRDNRFCGRCGHPLVPDKKERAMFCPECKELFFPRISPAVIIGLRHKDSIVLSHYAGREYKGRALLAGFCEIGETPEETVRREVLEEVGLHVKNVTYFGSQPWGFDSNLLLGYFADLDGDAEITLDEEELASASFVKREDIEYDPNMKSLTATMIEAFRTGKA